MTPKLWIADDLPKADYDAPIEDGRFWSSTGGDEYLPNVTRPIGFMRGKPRVRVKAWTMAILPTEGA
jgi:hypothetical protein